MSLSTTYTKLETDYLLQQIDKKVVVGYKGIATQANAPTPYSASTHPNGLFERYLVNAPLTSPNSWGNVVVTAADLDMVNGVANNRVILEVNNGVVSKRVERVKGDSATEVWTAKSYVANSTVYHIGSIWENTTPATATDIPNVSSIWVERIATYPISKKLTENLSKLTTKAKRIILDSGGYYHYKTGIYTANSSFAGLKLAAVEGDIFSFKGDVGYSALAAISFFDADMNNLGYIFGNNTSTVVNRDTGLVVAPKKTAFIVFGSYTANGTEVEVFQYQINSFVDSVLTNRIIESTKKISVKSEVAMTNGGVYNKTGTLLIPGTFPNAANFKYATVNVVEGDIYNYKSTEFYGSSVYGITMLDASDKILDRLYTTNNWTVTANFDETFVIPKNCVKLLVNLKLNALSSFSKLVVNSDRFLVPADLPTGNNGTNSPFVNAWSYNFLTAISADYLNSGFTYDAANKMATATTANSYLILNKNFKTYKRKHSYILNVSSDSVFQVGSSALTSSVTYQARGSVVLVDIPNLKLKILNVNTLATLAEVSISAFSAGQYSLEIFQNDLTLTATFKNHRTLNSTAVTYTSTEVDSPQGKLIDFPSIKLISGTISLIKNEIFLPYKPLIIFVGDSITESGYRVNSYASNLLANTLKQDGTILAKGGANHDVLFPNADTEIAKMKPKYISLLIGTNGGFTTAQINAWKTFAENNDIKLIVNRIPLSNNETTYPYLATNQNIENSGIYGARFDYATALNNNIPDGQNSVLFGDALHPNTAGKSAMELRFLNDVKLV